MLYQTPPLPFQVHQIVCLEHERAHLYAEVIQVVEARQTCWVRPLVLAVASCQPTQRWELDAPTLYDLRQGADLLWPVALFREALDLEVVPLLAQLEASKPDPHVSIAARDQFNQFVHQVWQAHAEVF